MESKLIAPESVVNLYELAGITHLAGIEDYTEGIYNGNSLLNHDIAQKSQHNYLLDEIEAREGFEILDVGCGLGTLLETAGERGVKGVGITISEDQVRKCRLKKLDVYLFNYKALPSEWNGRFDGIIANGSLEHFCQPEEAIAGKQNQIYREMFEIFSELLNPNSPQKVATTAVHFSGEPINPRKLLKNPFLQLFDTEGFHASVLHRGYGGYYPTENQLEECARDNFKLINKVDGTEDYRITSEHWRKEYTKALFTNPRVMKALAKHFLEKPMHTFWTISSHTSFQSWPWQFRGENPRTILYRHTWQKKGKK